MTTQVLPALTPAQRDPAAAAASAVLRQGGLVAVPTETVYGLAGSLWRSEALASIFEVKGRPVFDPLIVHLPEPEAWPEVSAAPPAVARLARQLAAAFWPGPFTMVLPVRPEVPELARAGLPTVAVRCSAHPVLQAVLQVFGEPVAAPSANRFGRISPTTAGAVVEELGGRIPLVLDGGPCEHGVESTIVAVEEGGVRLLRPGPVSAEALASLAPLLPARPSGSRPEAPGMLASHYAPATPLVLLDPGQAVPPGEGRAGLLAFGAETGGAEVVEQLSEASDLREAARRLFGCLRRLDQAGLRVIYARRVPEEGLGVAVMDRLQRAAAKR